MTPACQICSWIQNQWRRVTCSQTRTHFSDVYSDTTGEVHSSSSATRCCAQKRAIEVTHPSCCCVFPPAWIFPCSHLTSPLRWLTCRGSSRLRSSEEESDTRTLHFSVQSQIWRCDLQPNHSLMMLWGSLELPVFLLFILLSFYRQKNCNWCFRDHLYIETACSGEHRMQSGIYIDIHIYSLRMNFNKNKRNVIFLTGKKLNL